MRSLPKTLPKTFTESSHEGDSVTHQSAASPAPSPEIVWLYTREHEKHPFICLARDSLVRSGHSILILDVKSQPSSAEFRGRPNDGGGFAARVKRLCLVSAMKTIYRVWAWFDRGWLRRFPSANSAQKMMWFLWMVAKTVSERPQVVMVSGLQAPLVGWLANRFLRARLVYYAFELFGDQVGKLPWFWLASERFVIRHGVDALITQNEERARIYRDERKAPVQPAIVHNYKRAKPITRAGRLRLQLNLPEELRIVLYEGVLIPGRWLRELALSAEFLPDDVRLVFMGEASAWWTSNVESLLSELPLHQKVLVAPWVPHSELLGFVADADAGVVIYDDSVRNNYYCEPGKLSDYVQAGVPVIAPNFPTIGPVVRRYNIGALFDNAAPESIAQAINQVLATPRSTWQASIRKARRDLVWETQYPTLEKTIFGVCS